MFRRYLKSLGVIFFTKIFSVLSIALLISFNSAAQIIPDGGFEIWPTGFGEPLYWRTNNIYPPPLDCRQVFRDYLHKYAGSSCAFGIVDSCVQLRTQKPPIIRSLDISLNSKPLALHGYYMFFPIGEDKFYVSINLYKQLVLIGTGEFKSSVFANQYREFIVDINYLTADTPDVAVIKFTIDTSDYDKKLHNGSQWYIDELTFGPLSDLDSDENNYPTIFYLSQNYPNPFNPSTKISWQSPVGSWQTLKVYDILGNEIATLVDEYKSSGSYEVEFNATSGIRNLASGIYFYQLKAGDYYSTKKMLLLR